MKTNTTIITLAALSLSIAATQAGKPAGEGNTGTNGSGVVVTIPGAPTQKQHANGAVLTFTPESCWCYKVKGYSYNLTTHDNKQQAGKIDIGTIGDWKAITIDKPTKNTVAKGTVPLKGNLSGKDLEIIFDFTNAAALTGTISLEVDIYQTAPTDLNGTIEGPVSAFADSRPTISWSCSPTFGQ